MTVVFAFAHQRRATADTGAPVRVEPGPWRQVGTWATLAVLVVAVLVAGVWGISESQRATPPAAAVGDVVGFNGGAFTVDAVRDVDLSAPMAGPGMNMPMGAGIPQIPEGFRRVEIDVTVNARTADGLVFAAESFTVHGDGVPKTTAILADEGASLVPEGGVLSRTLTFEIPDQARQLSLSVDGGRQAVDITLGEAPPPHGH